MSFYEEQPEPHTSFSLRNFSSLVFVCSVETDLQIHHASWSVIAWEMHKWQKPEFQKGRGEGHHNCKWFPTWWCFFLESIANIGRVIVKKKKNWNTWASNIVIFLLFYSPFKKIHLEKSANLFQKEAPEKTYPIVTEVFPASLLRQ